MQPQPPNFLNHQFLVPPFPAAPVRSNVTPLLEDLRAYISMGWALVPIVSGKGPTAKGWNRRENCVTHVDNLVEDMGYGLAHAYCRYITCTLDIDDIDAATALLATKGIDLQALMDDPTAVTIESGNRGHAKLLYLIPDNVALPTRKITKDGKTIFELRCATSGGMTVQDVLPSSAKHPGTDKQYRWQGKGHFSKLPTLPPLLASLWADYNALNAAPAFLQAAQPSSSTLKTLTDALNRIDPDCGYQVWIETGMAMHDHGTRNGCSDECARIWDTWSSRSPTKYKGNASTNTHWRSFSAGKTNGITEATLLHHARSAGWTAPLDEVRGLFQAINDDDLRNGLARHVVASPALNFDLLPAVLSDMAKEVGRIKGGDPIMAAWAGLGVIAAAVDARVQVRVRRGFTQPAVLWLMCVANSGGKKSQMGGIFREVLKEIETERNSDYGERMDRFTRDMEFYNSRVAVRKKAICSDEYYTAFKHGDLEQNTELMDALKLPPQPMEPKQFQSETSSTTVAAVCLMCESWPRGATLRTEELGAWLPTLMEGKPEVKDKDIWLTGYDSSEKIINRAGFNNGQARKMLVSVNMLGNIQPDTLNHVKTDLARDGFMQRFMFTYSSREDIMAGTDDDVNQLFKDRWDRAIRVVSNIPDKGLFKPETPTVFVFSEDSKLLFKRYEEWSLEEGVRQKAKGEVYAQFIDKSLGQIARLALMFHIVQTPNIQEIPFTTVSKVIELMGNFILPNAAYLFAETSTDSGTAVKIAEWLKLNSWKGSVSTGELATTITMTTVNGVKLTNKESKVDAINRAMNLLDDAGWVKLSTTDTKKDNLWAIHPRIKEVYAGEIRTFNQIKHEELDTNFERNKSKQEFRAERQKSH